MSPDLSRRCLDPERMDDPRVSFEEMKAALQDVDRVNRFLGGWSASLRLLAKAGRGTQRISILDVGAGSGGTARAMADWGRRRGLSIRTTLVDLHPQVCRVAKHAAPGTLQVVRSDARGLPFRDGSFDVAHASLFLHHFGRDDIERILGEMKRVARWVLINDLERRPVALHAIWALVGMFSRSAIVKHDAPLSVRRGFRIREVEDWREWRGFDRLEIAKSFPYRILAWQCGEEGSANGWRDHEGSPS